MSCSEEESNAASVLSQMSQIQQNSSDTIEPQGMNVAHQCDVETTSNSSQEIIPVSDNNEENCPGGLTTSSLVDQETDTSSSTTFTLSNNDQGNRLQTTLEVSPLKVFPCAFCGKVFNKSYNLKTHHRVHTGERPYPCPICQHGFANLGDLKRHERTHTGEKPFTCEFCNKAFSDFGSHKRHLRLHTGFKPFKCDQCDRQFTRLDSYKNHTRLHTGERPYKCDECEKEFNYLTTYKRHLNIHSGDRPFSCELCSKKFTRMHYLKNHKLSHRKLARNAESQNNMAGNNLQEDLNTVDSSMPEVTMLGDAVDPRETGEENDDNVIQQVAQALSEGGVHVSVTTVVDRNGQPILIQTPLDEGSNETTSHTLILSQEILSNSPNDNHQILNLTGNADRKEHEEQTETRQLFITQPLFKTTQDSSANMVTEPQFVDPNFEGIMSVTQENGSIIIDEIKTQNKETENQSQQNILQENLEDPGMSLATNHNDVYIAIDPVQTSVQQILGEIHVAVNPNT